MINQHLKQVLVMRMSSNECFRDEQLQGQSRKIAELEARADYKDKRIDEIKEDMHELKESIDSIDKTITNFILKSVTDDNNLKDYINKLENRVTSLESRQDTIYKILMATPAIIALMGILVVGVQIIH